jgi:hypothetical protein
VVSTVKARLLLAAVVLGALVAAAMMVAARAHADEASFEAALIADGLVATPTSLALGYQICADISDRGVAGVDKDVSAGLSVGMSGNDVGSFMYDAVAQLCPSQMSPLLAWARAHTRQQF